MLVQLVADLSRMGNTRAQGEGSCSRPLDPMGIERIRKGLRGKEGGWGVR